MLNTLMLLIGISGVAAIGLNFVLEATNRLDKQHHIFALLYFYGSLTLCIYSIYTKVWLFVILNGFLTIAGIWGIWKVYQKKKNKNSK